MAGIKTNLAAKEESSLLAMQKKRILIKSPNRNTKRSKLESHPVRINLESNLRAENNQLKIQISQLEAKVVLKKRKQQEKIDELLKKLKEMKKKYKAVKKELAEEHYQHGVLKGRFQEFDKKNLGAN